MDASFCRTFTEALQPQHVVDGALHQAHCAGDGGTDDVLPLRGVAAVPPDGESGDAAALGVEFCGGHWIRP